MGCIWRTLPPHPLPSSAVATDPPADLTLTDPDRTAVKALGLEHLPAFVFVLMDGTVEASAEGWDPHTWRAAADKVATAVHWSRPVIPEPGDPPAFVGTPALG